MAFGLLKRITPSWKNVFLAILAAALLILAFPDFEYWFLAWFALVPLMCAIEREKASSLRSFILGWLFGTLFFFGTCWWLAYAPIHYASIPWPLAYSLILIVCLGAGLFPGFFAAVFSLLLRRLKAWAFIVAPFIWVACEFARYWITGNNWNSIGYSQAFHLADTITQSTHIGGIYLAGFFLIVLNSWIALIFSPKFLKTRQCLNRVNLKARIASLSLFGYLAPFVSAFFLLTDVGIRKIYADPWRWRRVRIFIVSPIILSLTFSLFVFFAGARRWFYDTGFVRGNESAFLIAVQPNIPMSGLSSTEITKLRDHHVELSDQAFASNMEKMIAEKLGKQETQADAKIHDEYAELLKKRVAQRSKLVVFPESPMNFAYTDDREFQRFINNFARENNVSVLFNSSEPDLGTTKYFNSAVMIGPEGTKIAEYDKIYLLPFGEAVPEFLEGIVPGFVGNFAYGREYDLFPVGDAKAGVMICFESHFGQLSREYVRNGADVIIEMTNDGYLGPTPVLRQHLANAVFRAVETNRPVLRVTNVGITAYINEKGNVLDATQPYQEDTRVWSVSKSDGSQTFYVKYGDWFAWLCSIVTVGLLAICIWRRKLDEA